MYIRSRVREKKRRKIKYLIMIIKCQMFCQMYIVFIVYLSIRFCFS